MASFHARVGTQQQFRIFPHPVSNKSGAGEAGETWQLVKSGTTTSAGAAGGTTLVDTNGDSGSADTYNGRYYVRLKSGNYKDLWKRIVDDNGSGTLTFEGNGFPGQVASGVEYEIYKTPEPVVVVESSSGETNMTDATFEGGNDYWNGMYAMPITGTHRGKKAKITDFDGASGVFTLEASFGSALAQGDVVVLGVFLEATPNDGLDQPFIDRINRRNNFAKGDGRTGPRGGSFGLTCQVVPSSGLAGADVRANMSPLAPLLVASGLEETVGSTCTVGTNASTSEIAVVTGDGENVAIGMGVIWNGQLRWVTAVADGAAGDDTVTVSPAFDGTPASGDLLYATRMYAKSTDGDMDACGIEWEVDGVRHIITGCRGTVSFSGESELQAEFSFSADHWVVEVEAAPYDAGSAYPTQLPILATERVVWLDSTKTDIGAITFTPGTVVQPKAVQGSAGINGRSGYQVVDYAAGATFRRLLDSSSESLPDYERWNVRTARDFKVAFGSHGGSLGLRLPVAQLIELVKHSEENQLLSAPNVLEAKDAGVTFSTVDSASAKVPDWSICIA